MSIDRTTVEATAFRQVYQAVVDRTPMAADLEEIRTQSLAPGISARGSQSRRWTAALAGAAVVAVAVGAVSLLPRSGATSPPFAGAPSVTGPYVAIDDPSLVLGSDVEVTFKDSIEADPYPKFDDVTMRLWVREEASGLAQAITVLEGDAESELMILADIAGERLDVEQEGVAFVLVETSEPIFFSDTVAVEWTDKDQGSRYLLLAQGISRKETLDIASTMARQGGSESAAIPEGLSLEYTGPQMLIPPPGAVMYELVYSSAIGKVELMAIDGWVVPEVGSLLRWSEASRVIVDEGTAVLMSMDIGTWGVIWTDNSSTTYVVEADGLTPEQTLAVARQVRSISQPEWEAIAVAVPSDEGAEDVPTASSFLAVSDSSAVASGNGWTVFAQVVEKARGRTAPGNRGSCVWLEREGKTMIDLGCGFEVLDEAGFWPAFSTVDGIVMIGSMPTEVATVRVEIDGQEPYEVTPIPLGNEAPSTLFVLELPVTGGRALIAIYDNEGNQLDVHLGSPGLDLNMPLEPVQ